MQAEHEQEKIELQKGQTASIQQLMDDTNVRLIKMEDDYRKQSKSMGTRLSDLFFINTNAYYNNKWDYLIYNFIVKSYFRL